MNRWKKYVVTSLMLLVGLYVLPRAGWAVSPEEIQQIEQAAPDKARVQPAQPRKLLVFSLTLGFQHSSIPYVEKALEVMGQKTGAFAVTTSTDMNVFQPDSLNQFDGVLFNNTVRLTFDDPELRKSLMDFVKGGKGVIGIHAATDNFYDWPEAAEMMGGVFDGHPWTADGTWAFKIDDPKHAIMQAFEGKNFKISDEIYRIKQMKLRENARVLMSLDMSDPATNQVADLRPGEADYPVSWVRTLGKGRVFYCSLGHNHPLFWNRMILQHYLDGIQFALGDLAADTTPLPWQPDLAKLDQLLPRCAAYEYGQDRIPLTELYDFIKASYGSPAALQQIEKSLLKFLQSDATLAAKQFICKQLSIMGTEQSVPVLAEMVKNPDTADMARYALERISSPAADEALLQALNQTDGHVKIGIINTLGQRRAENAVAPLGQLISDGNTPADIASAAVIALGKIGGEPAAAILAKAIPAAADAQKMTLCDAYLRCGDDLAAKKKNAKALEIYKQMFAQDYPPAIRIAAFKGMVYADSKNAEKIILDALRNEQSDIQTVANELVREVPGLNIKTMAAALPDLPEAGQVQLLASLADRGDGAAKESVVKATNSNLESVRLAALMALAQVGDAGSVSVLAEASAVRKGAEQQTARDSLYMLSGPDIDKEILTQIPKTDAKIAVELIKSIEKRDIKSAAPLLLKTATHSDPEIQMESWKTLKTAAGPDDMAKLTELLIQIQDARLRGEAVKTASAVALKIPDENQRAKDVLAAYPSVKDSSVKASLLELLGRIQSDSALPVLREALKSDQADLQIAAIRALGEWPNAKPLADLLGVVQTTKDASHRALAFRGYVRLIGLAGDLSPADKLNHYQEAINMAANENEKKMVVTNLPNTQSWEGLAMAESLLENESLRQEAEVAAVQLAQALMGTDPQRAKAVMQKIEKQTQNDTLRQQARDIINAAERFDDYIVSWEYSGPYTKDNANNLALFDTVFAPEQPDAQDVKWAVLPPSSDANRPWLAELDKAIGGDNRAAYLRTKVWSDKEQKVRLEAGSDDGVKIWLNDQVVHGNNVSRALEPGQDQVEVTLKQGWNTLLMKVTQGSGNWTACARFRALDGSKLEGLKVQIRE